MQEDEALRPSVFDTLPNEIISQIFLRGTQAWRELEPLRLPFPTLVSGVCTHWRILAHSTPALWTFILPPLHKGKEDCLSWTSGWIERSGTMLMSVVLDHKTVAVGQTYHEARAVSLLVTTLLETFTQHFHRLRRLHIRMDWPGTFSDFIKDGKDAPCLEELSLCARRGDNITTLSIAPFGVGLLDWPSSWHLPSLRKLRIKNICPPTISSLTSLTAYHLLATYQEAVILFTVSPHLTHLVLHNLLPIKDHVPQQFERIPAPSLRSIAISYPTPTVDIQAVYIFDLLLIPNLTYLEVDGNISASTLFESSLSAPSSVRKLRVCNGTHKYQSDHEFYRSLSGLQELELIRTPIQELWKPEEQLQRRRSMELREPRYRRRPMFHEAGLARADVPLALLPSGSPLSASTRTIWPELQSITVDVLSAEQLVPLTQFVKMRNLKSEGPKIQSIHLSSTAMRHLTGSMMRKGDQVSLVPSWAVSHRIGSDDHKGTKDVKEWLSEMTDVKLLPRESLGLLDADRVPLGEIP